MKPLNPPRLAVWLLEHFGPENNSEALAGDLCEDFRQGRSNAWYWRQVAAAIHWRPHLVQLLVSVGFAWVVSSPRLWSNSNLVGRPLGMILIAAAYLVSAYLPEMLPGVWRAIVALLSAVLFILFCRYHPELADHYWIFTTMFFSNFLFQRKKLSPPSFRMTYRELLQGDLSQEKKRLITRLEGTVEQESDPELRQAYAQAITVLESSKETPTAVKEKQ